MGEILHLHGTVRRVGNSLAVVIPAKDAKRLGLKPGDAIDADLRTEAPRALGLLKGKLPYEPFSRRGEDHDRV